MFHSTRLIVFVERGDWDATEEILRNLLERVRKHIGVELIQREKQDNGQLVGNLGGGILRI